MSNHIIASASAPGKAILFGEHAVVYGYTALASTLSDLRIQCDFEYRTVSGPSNIIVNFLDIKNDKDEHSTVHLPIDTVHQVYSMLSAHNPMNALRPTPEILAFLKDHFCSHHESMPIAQGLSSVAYLFTNILPELSSPDNNSHFEVTISIISLGLPLGAGLGSSAAFSVALAGGLFLLRHKLRDLKSDMVSIEDIHLEDASSLPVTPPSNLLPIINDWSYCAEMVIHGSPSGLDNTTSCLGGTIKFDKGSGKFEPVSHFPDIRILLTNTKVPRTTSKLVANVRELNQEFPGVVTQVMGSIGQITAKFLELLEKWDAKDISDDQVVDATAKLITINHHLLCSLGVGHPSLDQVISHSEKHGFHAKLTGAGGGGCAITLVSKSGDNSDVAGHIQGLSQELGSLGFEVLESSLGGKGLLWLK